MAFHPISSVVRSGCSPSQQCSRFLETWKLSPLLHCFYLLFYTWYSTQYVVVFGFCRLCVGRGFELLAASGLYNYKFPLELEGCQDRRAAHRGVIISVVYLGRNFSTCLAIQKNNKLVNVSLLFVSRSLILDDPEICARSSAKGKDLSGTNFL